jgi:hypothetical protein
VHDIDLYAGGMTEKRVPGTYVGKTFACILGKQFQNLKQGDRFWYERRQPEGFTEGSDHFLNHMFIAKYIVYQEKFENTKGVIVGCQ